MEFSGDPVVRTVRSTSGSMDSLPNQGTKILQAIRQSQKKKSTPQCLPEEPRDDCLLISRTWILTAHFTHVVFRVNLASRTSQVAEWMAQNFWVVGGDRGLSRVCFRVRQCLRGWGREWEEGKFLSVGFEGKIRNVYLGSSTPWLTFSPLVWVQ